MSMDVETAAIEKKSNRNWALVWSGCGVTCVLLSIWTFVLAWNGIRIDFLYMCIFLLLAIYARFRAETFWWKASGK